MPSNQQEIMEFEEHYGLRVNKMISQGVQFTTIPIELPPLSRTNPKPPKEKSKLSGWKLSLTIGAFTSFLVLATNTTIAIWSTTRPEYDDYYFGKHGLRILQDGSCASTKRSNTAIHILINLLSTILLGASNYTMQCLSAPTRDDVRKAHSMGRWVDIGVPSVRNLSKIPKRRSILWLLLVLSSVPLHLMFNSAVFASILTVNYEIYNVADVISGQKPLFSQTLAELNETNPELMLEANPWLEVSDSYEASFDEPLSELWELARKGKLANLSSTECIDAYATAFQTSHRHLLVVTEPELNSSWNGIPRFLMSSEFHAPRSQGCVADVYEWICSDSEDCDKPCRNELPAIKKNIDQWAPYDIRPVKYCLSQSAQQHCKLFLSIPILIFVLVANAIKICVIIYMAYCPPQGLLLVLGDAIESFLRTPDTSSIDSCMVTLNDIKCNIMNWNGPRRWKPSRWRWAAAISKRRWVTSLIIYLISLTISLFFLIWGIRILPSNRDIASLWALGFGTATETTLISYYNMDDAYQDMVAWSVLLANAPQICFSLLYFQFNALFTGMLAAQEWSDFGLKRRGIRVAADPQGKQRSRYFLQLPYRWGVPLLGLSALVHWLLSQSIFVVAVEIPKTPGALRTGTYMFPRPSTTPLLYSTLLTTCGYSPVAIIFVITASLFMVSTVIFAGLLRLPTTIPLVGSCSLAIAAACHHHHGIPQPEAQFLSLKWGVMQKPGEGIESFRPGHCGFSSGPVGEPEPGAEYS